MKTEDLVLNDSCEGEVIEEFCELFPYVSVTVLSQAFIIESVPIEDGTRFRMMSLNADLNGLGKHRKDFSVRSKLRKIFSNFCLELTLE